MPLTSQRLVLLTERLKRLMLPQALPGLGSVPIISSTFWCRPVPSSAHTYQHEPVGGTFVPSGRSEEGRLESRAKGLGGSPHGSGHRLACMATDGEQVLFVYLGNLGLLTSLRNIRSKLSFVK